MKEKLLKTVKNSLINSNVWKKEATLLCAVSGGADSVALLLCLYQLQKQMPYTLYACHIQHGLRGEESVKDEEFVYNLCKKLSVPLVIKNADLKATMHTPGIENKAREKRIALFQACMDEKKADALLLAHHQDDQAETVIMRLIRGAGLKGLSGICPERNIAGRKMLRPFLTVSKKEILQFLKQEAISFRHDESNMEPITTRNIIRLSLLPQMEKINPAAKKHIAATAERLRQDEECLSIFANQLYQECIYQKGSLYSLLLQPLKKAHPALQSRVIRKYYQEAIEKMGKILEEKELSDQDTQNVLQLLSDTPGTSINLPNNTEMHRLYHLLYLSAQGGKTVHTIKEEKPAKLNMENKTIIVSGVEFTLSMAQKDDRPSEKTVMIDKTLLPELCLRTMQEGDTIHPLGAKGKKELRRFFTDKKLDFPLRKTIPLLAWEEKILWVPGICTSEELRYNGEDNVVKLTLTNPEEDMPYIIKE